MNNPDDIVVILQDAFKKKPPTKWDRIFDDLMESDKKDLCNIIIAGMSDDDGERYLAQLIENEND